MFISKQRHHFSTDLSADKPDMEVVMPPVNMHEQRGKNAI